MQLGAPLDTTPPEIFELRTFFQFKVSSSDVEIVVHV
jgi:hypothetical protein